MFKRVPVVLVAMCLCAAAVPSLAQEKMITYQLVILKKGPNAAKAQSPEGQQLLKAHVDFLYKKAAEGVYKAAGPFTDDGEIQGIAFVAADTPEKALAIEAEDPGVKEGIFVAEAVPFLSPEGYFGKWEAFPTFEHVYFGFLVRGANRSQSKEEAQELQKQHMAYMAGQHKLGKLVVAGPFMVDGDRRGIVVYRVATPEEAKERANADPMVKVGRLAVELHPWQVPKGALPK
jgi:uncharacterized protein YciI